jgi:hypothetical protein
MNTFVTVFSCLLAASQASVLPLAGLPLGGLPYAGRTLVRAPAHDSASIANHRLGGNFAYAVQTAEAFAEVTPKIAHQTIAVAEHTHVHQPAAIRTIQPAPIITKTFAATPVLAQQPVFGQEAVIGPVATEVHVRQPIYKTKTYHQTHQVVNTVAQPAVAVGTVAHVAAAPAVGAYGLGLGAHGLVGAHGLGLGGLGYAGQLGGLGYAGHLGGLGYAGHLGGAYAAVPAALPVAAAH